MQPAIAVLEFDSIAAGIEAGDAMVKRAPLHATYAGTIQPGKYVVLVSGDTASVEEAVEAGRSVSGSSLVDLVLLPNVHPDVTAAVAGRRQEGGGEAIGVIETASVVAVIAASDAALKGARVVLVEIRLDGLGGKGFGLFAGPLAEVQVALDIGSSLVAADQLVGVRLIPQIHPEMLANLVDAPRFRMRATGEEL